MQTLKINAPLERFKVISSVYLVLCRGKEILLSKRANTGYEDGNYGLVSGHVEANETLRAALARESMEEIGLNIPTAKIELALLMHRFASGSLPSERMDFFMRVNDWIGEPINCEPDKCSELNWFDMTKLPVNTIAYIRYGLDQIQSGINYCEYGWTD